MTDEQAATIAALLEGLNRDASNDQRTLARIETVALQNAESIKRLERELRALKAISQ